MSENSIAYDDECDAIYCAADDIREAYEDDGRPSSPWPAAFERLSHLYSLYKTIDYPTFDLKKGNYDHPASTFPLWKEAYKLLRPLVGRQGAIEILANVGGHFADFKISISKRGPKGRAEILRKTDQRIARELKQERVGTAIMLLRQRGFKIGEAQRHLAGKRIAAFVPADLVGPNDGTAVFGDFVDTKKQWLAWKEWAFFRGFADIRALWAELDGLSWPNDQFWLNDV